MSVERLAKAIGECLSLPVDELRGLGTWVDDHAAPPLHRLALESARPELAQAVVALGVAREAIDRALLLIDSATLTIRSYSAELVGAVGASANVVPSPARPDRRYDEVRRRLPPPVPGGRTVGAWIDDDGVEHELVSGNRDEWFAVAAAYARERGWVKGRAVLGLARHVEVKFAMRMRARDLQRRPGDPPIKATIVIDRPPCGVVVPGEWTCDGTLDDWLPPGATLTVIDRDGTRYTYRGTEEA